MPQISVNTVQFFKAGPDGLPIENELELASIDGRFVGIRFPIEGRTFLYGQSNPGVNYLLGLAPAVGLEAVQAELTVDIEHWIKHKIRLSNDEERGTTATRFLSFSRATKEVLDRIDVLSLDSETSIFGENGVVLNPSLLSNILHDDLFKHLWVIAYTVETKEVGRMQVATVFNMDAVVDISTSSVLSDVQIVI
tara:strand:+ start:1290 stop:1871 length:582 start_codon:yes stop_codon:yes gene_type:complete